MGKQSDYDDLGAAPADGDMVPFRDVSDTSMAATGTTKEMSVSNLLSALKAATVRALGFFDTSNDGSGSGLDADLLDGSEATDFATAAQGTLADSAVQPGDPVTDLNVSATDRFLGRDTTGAGSAEEITPAAARTILNVEDGADVTDAANVDAAGATMNADTDVSATGWVLDEDDFASDSATKVPTQQSVKAWAGSTYVTQRDTALTVTVGSGGDHATIGAALAAVAKYRPLYVADGVAIKINLLTGFTMAEQVIIEDIDLGFVEITSTDATVTIDRSALTESRIDGKGAWVGDRCTFPVISVLFDMDTSGTADSQDGFILSNSRIHFTNGAGCQNATGRGLNAHHGSWVHGDAAVFSGAGEIGVRVANGSVAHLEDLVADNCMSRGLSTSAAFVDVTGASATGCGRGIDATEGSVVIAALATVTGYTTTGIRALDGAVVDARGASAQKSGSDTATDIVVTSGGQANASDVTGGFSQGANAVTGDGTIFDDRAADDDVVYVGAGSFEGIVGSPVLDKVGVTAVWLLEPGTNEGISTSIVLPPHWQTYDVQVDAANAGAGSGDYVLRVDKSETADTGDMTSSSQVGSDTTVTAAAQDVKKRTTIASGVTVPSAGQDIAFRVNRLSSGNTLANDIGVQGLRLVRAS